MPQSCGMNNKTKIDSGMEARIAGLASRVSGLKRGQKGKVTGGVPPGLRAEIVAAWRDSGLGMGPFGRRIGISGQSMANWSKAKPKKSAKRKRQRKKQFREVRVVPELPQKKDPPRARGFELALPGGARITGLGMEEIAQLLGMKGVAR